MLVLYCVGDHLTAFMKARTHSARLVPVLHSGDKHVKGALNKWRDVQPALAKQFKDELLTVDASGDVLALVEKLQDCFIVKA